MSPVSARRLSRRAFLKGLGLVVAMPRAALAQTTVRLGLVVSRGPFAESVVRGAELGLADANALAILFGKRLDLLQETVPAPEAAGTAALRLVRHEQVLALLGGADDGSAEALRDAAEQSGALFFNVVAASDRLRGARCHRHAFHVYPSLAMHVGAVGWWLIEERKLNQWTLVTSDTPWGREVEAAALAFLARRGGTAVATLRVAAGTTAWQPVLAPLRAGAAGVAFVGLESADLLGFIRAYRAAGPTAHLAGVTPDPGVLFAADPDEIAGVWPLAWHHELQRFSARDLNNKFRRRFQRPFDGPAWAAWAAVKLLGEAVVRGGATDVPGLLKFIDGAPPFDAHKGQALTFREWDQQLRQPMYLARPRPKERAEGRVGALAVFADVPRGNLDLISPPREESRCGLGQ